ncbi:MAG: SPFH domain-containing protein [Bacteroidota bacterium]|jgi:membrane protease subunit (stomatin/prohibitin family)
MGLFDKLRNEFVDIIEWLDDQHETIVWRFPRYQNEIKMGAKLVCREGQQAVFINEGKIADIFSPGTHTLTTQNLPILATLKGWKYGFNSPFKAEVYFVNTTQFTDQKWGTKNPITVEDARFGFIELRAFGNYNFRVVDAGKFITEIVGTDGNFTIEEINGQLRTKIATSFGVVCSKENIPIEKFLGNFSDLQPVFQEKLNATFDGYGLKLTDFNLENVSMPEELKKEIFEYTRLNRIDANKLAQLKTAKSIEIAAGNEGIGGAGVGIGVGVGMGNMMGNMMQNMNSQMGGAGMPPPLSMYYVAVNGQQSGPFNLQQLQQMSQSGQFAAQSLVWKQGMAAWVAAGTVPELTALFSQMPPPPPPPPMP